MTWRALSSRGVGLLVAVVSGVTLGACLLLDPPEKPLVTEPRLPPTDAPGGAAGALGGDLGGAGGAAAAPARDSCESHADCTRTHADEPYHCRASDRSCVPLRTEACPLVLRPTSSSGQPADADPNVIVVGAFAWINPLDLQSSTAVYNYQLALEELSGAKVGGLPVHGSYAVRRPVVIVVCNNDSEAAKREPELIQDGLRHLVETLEVPGLVGALLPGDLRAAGEYAIMHDVFLVSPQGATDAVVNLDDGGRVWTMLGQPADLAPTYREVVRRVEGSVRSSWSDVPERLRFAAVVTEEPLDTDLFEHASSVMRPNSQSVLDNIDGGTWRTWTLTDSEPPEAIAQAIAEFSPHVVVSFAGEPFTGPQGVMTRLEQVWGGVSAPAGTRPRPFYVLSPTNHASAHQVQALLDNLAQNGFAAPYGRVVGVGVAPPADRSLHRDYLVRLLSKYPNAQREGENYYDALYYLLYAVYGAGSVELNGASIAAGMQRLVSGRVELQVGPAAISEVFGALAPPEGKIRLLGTLGPPDFDLVSGVRKSLGSIYCFAAQGGLQSHVLVYDPATGELVGDPSPCFESF